MRTISGFIRTRDEKIWFWISWWDFDVEPTLSRLIGAPAESRRHMSMAA
jgi:hypothetical protein